jgi:hypothetical protein
MFSVLQTTKRNRTLISKNQKNKYRSRSFEVKSLNKQ